MKISKGKYGFKKITLFFVIIIAAFFALPIYSSGLDPIRQFNQSQTANITGNSSTTVQNEINGNLSINSDGKTWNTTEILVSGGDFSYQRRPNTNDATLTDCTNKQNAYNYDGSVATCDGSRTQDGGYWWNNTEENGAGIVFNAIFGVKLNTSGSRAGSNPDSYFIEYGFAPTPGTCTSVTSWITITTNQFPGATLTWYNVTNTTPVTWTNINNTCFRFRYTRAGGDDAFRIYPDAFHVDVNYNITRNYGLAVEHNATEISYSGDLNNVNISINFTSTLDDLYNMTIFDFTNSLWNATFCQNQSSTANTFYNVWCNVTTNPTNFVSGDNKIRVRLNSTTDSDQGTLREEYVQYYLGSTVGYLEVNLTNPDSSSPSSVMQNQTSNVNATIVCRGGPCGNVYGTIMYNLTSTNPDTPVNTTQEDKPFFIQESPANALKSCGVMNLGDSCQLNWTINATGDVNSGWKIGVLFNSSYTEIQENNTNNATVSIMGCSVDLSTEWSVNFGLLAPDPTPKEAPGNPNKEYNITVNSGSCDIDIYINGTDLINTTYNSEIKVGNVTWSNTSNTYSSSYNLSNAVEVVKLGVTKDTNVTTWYWLNVPPVYAGYYNGIISIWGVKKDDPKP